MTDRLRGLWAKYREVVAYLIVGGLTTVVSLVAYYAVTATFLDPANPVQLQAANVISWIAAVTFAYFANRRFVFQSHDDNRLREAGLFVASRIGTLLMEMSVMFVTVTLLGMNDRVAKLIAQVVVIVGNYVLSKFIVFRKKNA